MGDGNTGGDGAAGMAAPVLDYLWGMETKQVDNHKPQDKQVLDYLWGMETFPLAILPATLIRF